MTRLEHCKLVVDKHTDGKIKSVAKMYPKVFLCNIHQRIPSRALNITDIHFSVQIIKLVMNLVTIVLCMYKMKWKGYQSIFLLAVRRTHQRCYVEKDALKIFTIFTGKYLCCSLQHRCFPVNIVEFLGTLIQKNICEWLLLDNDEKQKEF